MKKAIKYSILGLAALCTVLLCGGYYMLGYSPETGRPRFTQPQHSRILRFHVRALSRTAPLGG